MNAYYGLNKVKLDAKTKNLRLSLKTAWIFLQQLSARLKHFMPQVIIFLVIDKHGNDVNCY